MQAINLYAPKEYQGLYWRLLLELASESKNYEYCDMTMLRFPAHKQILMQQFESYMEYYHSHRAIHVFQLEKLETQSYFSRIIRLANVQHVGTTDLTNRLGEWSIFVKDTITGVELQTIDTIIREFLDEDRKFKQLPYRRTEPLDNMTQGYISLLRKQYSVKPNALPPSIPAWGVPLGSSDAKLVGTVLTTSNSVDGVNQSIKELKQGLLKVQDDMVEVKQAALITKSNIQ